MLRAGQYDLVLEAADGHFGRLDSPADGDAWVAVAASFAALALRAWGKAVEWSDAGLKLKCAEHEAEGRLRYYRGTARFYTGDFYGAGEDLQRFLALVGQCQPLGRLAGEATYNLAYVMRALKRAREEIALFQEAAAIYEGQGHPGQVNTCRYEAGWSLLLNREADQALPELQAVEDGLAAEPDPELATDLQIAWALYHHLCANFVESQRLCRQLLAQGALPHRQRADVAWILSLGALQAGDLGGANRHAEVAHAAALEEWLPTQLDRIEALRVQLAATCRPERGRS